MEFQDVAMCEKEGNDGCRPARWYESTSLWWKTADNGPNNLVQFQTLSNIKGHTLFFYSGHCWAASPKSVMSVLFACVLIILQ